MSSTKNHKDHKYNAAICVGDLIGAKFMLRGLCAGVTEYGINLHIFHGLTSEFAGEDQEKGQTNIYRLPDYDKMDLLIVAPFFLSTDQEMINGIIDNAKNAGVPVITVGIEHDGCFCVMSDYSEDIYKVTDHLISQHHCKDMVFISGIDGDYVSEQRTEGFRRALIANGLEYNREEQVYFGGFWDDPAVAALERILSRSQPIPDAIVCANDTMASAVIRRLTELSYKIPQDIIVTGMDGIDEASGYITTAVIFSELTGKLTAQLADKILKSGIICPEPEEASENEQPAEDTAPSVNSVTCDIEKAGNEKKPVAGDGNTANENADDKKLPRFRFKAQQQAIPEIPDDKIPRLTIVPPVLQPGASCGCTNDNIGISAMKRHELFEDLYNARKYTKDILRLIQDMTNCSTYDEMTDKLYYLLSKIWCNSSWICVCDDFFDIMTPDDINSADALAAFRAEQNRAIGYSKNMVCLASYRRRAKVGQSKFKTSDILPDFFSVADESNIILYSPLYYRELAIGYLAFDFFPWSNLVYMLNTLAIGISTTLESVRRQNELLAYAKKVDELYITDLLTGLYNRRGFFRLYPKRRASCKTSFMVISIDLDNLKQINDNFGHKEGDNAISTMANAMKAAAGKKDIAARFGGDEFIIFGNCDSEQYLKEYVEKIFDYIEKYNLSSGKPYNVHASCGTVIVPVESGMHIDYYINQADAKMYMDKQQHKRQRELFRKNNNGDKISS